MDLRHGFSVGFIIIAMLFSVYFLRYGQLSGIVEPFAGVLGALIVVVSYK